MMAKGLKMDGDKILGAEDFVTSYSADNADAFMTEDDYFFDGGDGAGDGADANVDVPHFVESTPGAPAPADTSGGFHFNFTGVRPMPANN